MQNNVDSDAIEVSSETFSELQIGTVENFIKNTSHSLQTNHKRVCFIIIQRIYRRVMQGYRFGGIKFNGNLIIDGHHRYIAYKLADIEFESLKGGKCHSYSSEMKEINELEIDIEQDWDYNNLSTRKYCTDDFLEGMEKTSS